MRQSEGFDIEEQEDYVAYRINSDMDWSNLQNSGIRDLIPLCYVMVIQKTCMIVVSIFESQMTVLSLFITLCWWHAYYY